MADEKIKTLPKFSLSNQHGQIISNQTIADKRLVLYFYPKDDTPGCTIEAQDFSKLKQEFAQENCVVLGVSRDTVGKHLKFVEKCGLTIDLLADVDSHLCEAFDVLGEKSMYGKKYFGIIRSTFLFDENGKLLHSWRKVNHLGHAKEVLAELQKNK